MFAERCRELRIKQGLSQEQLAEICSVSRQTVSKWETGVMLPEMEKLLLLSDYFEVSLDNLIRKKSLQKEDSQQMINPVFSFEKICELILPRRNQMEVLYEDAKLYDVIFDEKRNEAIKKVWGEINLSQYGIKTIHDCSIGTGQMTIALAELGYSVSGSDLSKEMLEQCKENQTKMGVEIPLTQCDFRELTHHVSGQFDCVMSTGNSLAHVENGDVLKALLEMDQLIKPKGYLYFDLRNWDHILEKHQRFYFYHPFFKGDQRINLMQVWDYNLDGTITFNLIYSFEKEEKIVDHKISSIYYFPISRKKLEDAFKKMGYRILFEEDFPSGKADLECCEWYHILAQKL